jgi:hypothetical protein
MSEGRLCGGCQQWQPWGAFALHRGMEDGHQRRCRACFKAYREANPGRIKHLQAERMKQGRDRILARRREYYAANRARLAADRLEKYHLARSNEASSPTEYLLMEQVVC